MGEVYRARDTRLGRDVAVKALPEGLSADSDRLARLKREARILASLNHPNIGAIYGLEEADGRLYLALEYVKGETLADRITRGPLPVRDAVEICLQIAAGLEAAHEGGIVHRDLKPGNVMITPDDVVKVLDFGLAKVKPVGEPDPPAADARERTASLETMPGLILGTPAYLSPEQARGKEVDRRADIWSFGCTLYECLTGKRPFRADTTAETMALILEREPDWSALPEKTPPAVLQLLQRCLEKDPKHRLRDIGDARLSLEELKAGRVLVPSRPSPATVAARDAASLAATPSVAVLPFADLSPGKDQEYFADGLSEELINVLAKIQGLRVVSRTSAFFFKGKDVDLASVARKLGVAMVLEGSVRKAGNRLRITAQLIQVATDSHLWSQTYDRELEDIFAVQDSIARSVVSEIRTSVLGEPRGVAEARAASESVSAAGRGRGKNVEAYQLYLRGRFFESRRTRADVAKGIEYYRQALDLESENALAWAWLSKASSYEAGKGWIPFAEGFRMAREAAERAVRIDPGLAEGHAALAEIRAAFDWDWQGAAAEIRLALDLAPGDAEVVRTAAEIAFDLGNVEEALTLGRRAVALDPLSVPAHRYLEWFTLHTGHLDEAEGEARTALELSPLQLQMHADLAFVRLLQGRLDEACAELEAEPDEENRLYGRALTYHAMGRKADSDASLQELIRKYSKTASPQIADVHACRGEPDQAFEWLERAADLKDPGVAQIEPNRWLRGLHSDPRWNRLLIKIGLAD